MFANVYSLRDVMHVLPALGYDMLWADFVAEDKLKDGTVHLHMRGLNQVFNHAKFYRRQFLIDNGLRFDPKLEYNEDSAFNTE